MTAATLPDGWTLRTPEEADLPRLIELRASQGESVAGVRTMKPKALRTEIAERLQRQAEIDEAEIV